MTKGKLTLGLLALLATAAAASCSIDDSIKPADEHEVSADYGIVTMRLTIDGVNINTLRYSIALASAPTTEVAGGTADVSADGATATASAELLPGSYVVRLTSPDDTTCLGTGTFTIVANGSTNVALTLNCGDTSTPPQTGRVNISVSGAVIHNSCAITEAVATPLRTSGDITLNAEATPGATFSWSVLPASAGTFTTTTAATTRFNCDVATDATIRVAIVNGTCSDAVDFPVTCLGAAPPASTTAPPASTTAPPASTTAPPATTSAPPPVVCGDGVVGGTEQCDDGNQINDDACTNACTLPPPPPADSCSSCLSDTTNGHDPDIAAFNTDVCEADPLCQAVRKCVSDSGCFASTNGSQVCYCGPGVSVADCISPTFVPQGVCATSFTSGLPGVTTNQDRLTLQFDTSKPTGQAFAILSGARDVPECVAECRF
jgi:cysteine-rich repeat protein